MPYEGFMQATFDTSMGALKSRQRRETPIPIASKLLLAHQWLPLLKIIMMLSPVLNAVSVLRKNIEDEAHDHTRVDFKRTRCSEKATGNEVKQYAIQRMRDQLNDCDRTSLITSTDIGKTE